MTSCQRCGSHKDPVTVSDSDNHIPKEDKEGSQLQVSLGSCKRLATISCLQGKKTDLLLHVEGEVIMTDPQAPYYLVLIGVANGGSITKESPIVTTAIDNKNEVEKLMWQEDGSFIYPLKVDALSLDTKQLKFTIPITVLDKDQYIKLTSKSYNMHMLWVQNGADAISTASVPMDSPDKDEPLPDYQAIGLKALSQSGNDTGWFLKGEVATSYRNKNHVEVGFLLVKEGVNPYNLVKQAIADENEWPIKTELFNNGHLIVVPGKFRNLQPNIVGNLLTHEAPIQSGKYKICCYFVQNKTHYYLSQMEHFLAEESSLAQDSPTPLITFDGSTHRLTISNLKLSRDKITGQFNNVTLAGDVIEYFADGQKKSIPSDQASYVVFIKEKKGVPYIWRTAMIESLVKALRESNSNDSTNGNILVVQDPSKPLSQSAIAFFSSEAAYSYFPCLCATQGSMFKFHGSQEELSITENKEEEQLTNPLKVPIPPITLDNTGAHITLHVGNSWKRAFFSDANYTTYVFPKVTLSSKIESQNQGYIVVKAEHKETIQKTAEELFRKIDKNKGYIYDPMLGFIFLKRVINTEYDEKRAAEGPSDFSVDLYKAYSKNKVLAKEAFFISYWFEAETGKIVCSDPVSIVVKHKSKEKQD